MSFRTHRGLGEPIGLTNQALPNFLHGELRLQMATLGLVAAHRQSLTSRAGNDHIKLPCHMTNGVDRERGRLGDAGLVQPQTVDGDLKKVTD